MAAGEDPHAPGVVSVIVGDDDGMDFFGQDAQGPEAIFKGFRAETGIHQDPGVSAHDQNGISPASAS
jgi:hypothetical protein